jgi:hypothetical protein
LRGTTTDIAETTDCDDVRTNGGAETDSGVFARRAVC